jgi:hypothetical protein
MVLTASIHAPTSVALWSYMPQASGNRRAHASGGRPDLCVLLSTGAIPGAEVQDPFLMRIGASVNNHARHGTPRHDISDRIESDEAHRRAARAGRRSGQHRWADDVSRSGRATACSRPGRGDGTRVPSSTGRPFARSSPIQALPERAPETPQTAKASTDPALRAIARPGLEPGTPRSSAACPADRLSRRLRRNPVRFVSAAGSASTRPHRRDSESECATAVGACPGRSGGVRTAGRLEPAFPARLRSSGASLPRRPKIVRSEREFSASPDVR